VLVDEAAVDDRAAQRHLELRVVEPRPGLQVREARGMVPGEVELRLAGAGDRQDENQDGCASHNWRHYITDAGVVFSRGFAG
jgi:hypothetical protein